jgi:multicomponent Na+:H+ antiporter subunit F
MTAVVVICAVLLTAAGVLALIRAERGPSMLDRTVALDIIVTVVVAALALYASVERRADVVPILVVLSLVGFVGSVTISRFASVEPAGEGRVRSREEIAQEEAERIRAEEEAQAQRRARRAREADASPVEAPSPAQAPHEVRAEHAAVGGHVGLGEDGGRDDEERSVARKDDAGEAVARQDDRDDAAAREAGMRGADDDPFPGQRGHHEGGAR